MMPSAYFVADGPSSGRLAGVTRGMKYKIGNGSWKNINSSDDIVFDDIVPCTIYVVKNGNEATTEDSRMQEITVTKAALPNLSVTQPTTIGGKGSIPMSDAHEYSTDKISWTVATGVASLEAGTYYVRVKAGGAVLASECQTVVISASLPEIYTVVYDPNGGSGEMTSDTVSAGEPTELPVCGFTAPDGKRFAGWAVGSTSGALISENGAYVFTGSATVYAVWEDIPPVEYEVTDGKDGKWTKGTPDGLTFVVDGDHDRFIGISVDGSPAAKEDYTDASGSTVITLKASYLETLEAGRYTLRVNFTDGYAEMAFEIVDAETPVPAEESGA